MVTRSGPTSDAMPAGQACQREKIMVALGPVAVGEDLQSRTCQHLAPLERVLAADGTPVGPGQPCPHDADWGMWFYTEATLDIRRVGREVVLDPCVRPEAYEGVLADSDVTFYCARCKRAIVGRHPGSTGPDLMGTGR